MKVITADHLGLCFGVRDALAVIDRVPEPEVVTIHGQLVHNEVVIADLNARGFHIAEESRRAEAAAPVRSRVLITAHGISQRERRRLESAGATLIDTTCPLVLRAHHAAQGLQAQGYHVLLIGRKGHVEVRGIIEDLASFDVIEDERDVANFGKSRLGIVCQTTVPEHRVEAIRSLIAERNPGAEIRFIDTICLPTKEHQRALERLLAGVEAVVVVGGRNSNNTRELVELCRRRVRPVFHVQTASDLDTRRLASFSVVGLTGGTSTLDRTIDEVRRALEEIEPLRRGEHPVGTGGGL
ncbi:MAG: 4-hydroxy-3-methylbut-2-enyl diphosphate reductase [Isosphaeraceae bacterium]